MKKGLYIFISLLLLGGITYSIVKWIENNPSEQVEIEENNIDTTDNTSPDVKVDVSSDSIELNSQDVVELQPKITVPQKKEEKKIINVPILTDDTKEDSVNCDVTDSLENNVISFTANLSDSEQIETENSKEEKPKTITIEVSDRELAYITSLRKGESWNYEIDTELYDDEEEDSGDDYTKFLFFKHKKNKGYKLKQPFEDKEKYALLEKGVSFVNFSAGFKELDIYDYLAEPIAEIESLSRQNYTFQVSGGRFISNNVAIGAKFSYSFSELKMKVNADVLDLIIGASTYETNNVSNVYTGNVFVKNYIPLDKANRFFIVTESGITYAKTNALTKNIYDEGVKTTKVDMSRHTVGLGISPGFMFFLTKGLSFEFTVSPLLAYWNKTTTINNEVEKGSVNNYGLSFKVIPYNISFGFGYYFGLDYDKNRKYLKRINKY